MTLHQTRQLRQFFERLPKDGWEIGPGGELRQIHRRYGMCCPITAALEPTTDMSFYPDVAIRNGLNLYVANAIAAAADGCRNKPTYRRIRRLLLAHCGLKEGM